MNFGKILRFLLQERELTQKEAATQLHLAKSTINGYIQGIRQPSFETLLQIASYFDVSTDYLLGHSTQRHPVTEPLSEKELFLLGLFRDMTAESQLRIIQLAQFLLYLERRKNKK